MGSRTTWSPCTEKSKGLLSDVTEVVSSGEGGNDFPVAMLS